MTRNDRNSSEQTTTAEPTETDRLRALIGRAGLSQRGAARELGVDDRTMRYWCSGQQTPPPMAIRALDPVTRHRENLRRTIADNRQVIEQIESGQMTGLGFGPGPAAAGSAAAEAQRLRRQNEELQALLRQEEAFERKQDAYFRLLRDGTDEAIERARVAEAEWREAEREFERVAQEIRAGKRP